MKMKWNPVGNRLENLNVLTIDGKEVGFIYKPKDSKTDINFWRCHRGIGDNTQFMGHADTKKLAKLVVEAVV